MKPILFKSKVFSTFFLFIVLLGTAACDRTQFRKVAVDAPQVDLTTPGSDIPVDPVDPPVTPPPVVNPPVVTDPPIVTEPPIVTPPPVVVVPPAPIQPPVVVQPPTITPPPVVNPPPTVGVPPEPVQPPVATQPPVITPPPVVIPPQVVVPPPAPPTPVQPPIATQPPVIAPPPAVTPPPVVVVPPAPTPVQASGKCKDDSSTQLLSCMMCQVPMNPPPPAQFSQKGLAFINIMAIGCSVPNKSEPKNYQPPTREELLQRFSRLSPTLYPDSVITDAQKNVVNGLLNDPKLQKKMFGGLWYQPPYSDDFETYFGASIGEVVNLVCYENFNTGFTPDSAVALQSKDFIDCQYGDNPFNCKERPEYITANKYRDQLRAGMRESIKNPYVPPAPTPAKHCTWESFEGDYDMGGQGIVNKWLHAGYTIGIEIGNLGGLCEPITALPTGANKPRGEVKMAAFICK